MNAADTFTGKKRFSMNFEDTLQQKPKKRFSMNFLDTLTYPDPPGGGGGSKRKKYILDAMMTLPPPVKRFTMNYMDTIGRPNLEESGNGKRSDDRLAKAKAKQVLFNIDIMVAYMLERNGLDYVCQKKEWRDLMEVRSFLSSLVADNSLAGVMADMAICSDNSA